MKTLLFFLLVGISTASFAGPRHHQHYGYGYTNFYFVPGNVYERDVYRTRNGYLVETSYPTVRYWPYRTRKHYDYYPPYYAPRNSYYWWW